MDIKMMYNHICLRMHSNIKWQRSTMQNSNYFFTNLTADIFFYIYFVLENSWSFFICMGV